jgi:hypothetical protein
MTFFNYGLAFLLGAGFGSAIAHNRHQCHRRWTMANSDADVATGDHHAPPPCKLRKKEEQPKLDGEKSTANI